MSQPTRREPTDSTRREGPGATRREDTKATRREGSAATRREARAGSRGTPADAPASRRLSLPDSIAESYDYLHDLPAAGGEADLALLQSRQSGERVIFKSYKTGVAPDVLTLASLTDVDHVVELLDWDRIHGTWELQTYYELGSLKDWVQHQGGQLPPDVLTEVVDELAQALGYLHGLDIAHRDLKPANVLVRQEDPLDLVLADFGLAKGGQQFTNHTKIAKGTWHYAAPEVYQQQVTTRSDWFALGAMVFEFFTGRQLFAMADGSEVSDDDARSRCLAGHYSTESIDDPRWRLLVDGLLTWDKARRWSGQQVTAWLRGESPPVHRDGAPAGASTPAASTGYRPPWSPTLVTTPQQLAEELRRHWDEAASALTGRPEPKLLLFLRGFPDLATAVAVVESAESGEAKLVRLQALLDPQRPVQFRGVNLDDESLARRVERGAAGDSTALDWLEALLAGSILTALAESTGSHQAARADYLLGQWKQQADRTTSTLPSAIQPIGRQAFRNALPELVAIALSEAGEG